MEIHQGAGIYVIQRLEFRKSDAEAMQEPDGVGPPRNVGVHYERRDDEETGDVVDEERFLTDGISAVDEVLDRHIVDVVAAGKYEEETREMISPKVGLDIRVANTVDAGHQEGQDQHQITVDPHVVRHEIVVTPVNALEHNYKLYPQQLATSTLKSPHIQPTTYNWLAQRINDNMHYILFSIMNNYKKENVPPAKQGVFYQLSLSKNNGPFLSKDIMYSNPKSNTLLSTPSALSKHKKMVETLTQLERTAKMQHSHEEKTENFSATF